MVSQRDSNNAMLDRLGLTSSAGPVTQPLPDTFVAQWPRQTVLRLSGPDADKFLQGQLTCQMEQLTEHSALYGAACTPKGKAIANFRLVRLDNDDILLRVSTDLAEQVLQHF